jgi:probable rRNA maturation factor
MTPAPRAGQRLRVDVSDARGRRLSGPDVSGLGAWLSRAAPSGTRGRVTIALVTDEIMRRLNRQYRGRDTATDVLSFPADAPLAARKTTRLPAVALAKGLPSAGLAQEGFLGDLAIARGVAARQARAQGHATRVEIRVLALHGLLHLLGYDHEVDAGEMARLEERLRRRAGVPSGLISRPDRRHPPHA